MLDTFSTPKGFTKVNVRNMFNGFQFPSGETFINTRPAGNRLIMRYLPHYGGTAIKEMYVSQNFFVLIQD